MFILVAAMLSVVGVVFLAHTNRSEALVTPAAGGAEMGKQLFAKHRCAVCHRPGGIGKSLDGVGERLTREELRTWIADPKKIKPKTLMPKFPLKPAELDGIVEYLLTLKQTEQ